MKVKLNERTESFIHMVGWCAIWLCLLSYLTGCGVYVDNPFYPPTSRDVNKIESKAVNNYLPRDVEKKGN